MQKLYGLRLLSFQMAAKMGEQPNMNSSSPVIDASLYGFGGQKRSLDNGGQPSARPPCKHDCGAAALSGRVHLRFVRFDLGSCSGCSVAFSLSSTPKSRV